MCNLYTIEPALREFAEDFERFLDIHLELSAGGETLANKPWAKMVYPKYQGLFMRPLDPKNPSAGLEPAVGRWGVVPFFHKGAAATWKFPTNNARSEEMATKASFRDCVKARRCIIPATSIIEWSGPKGSKIQHRISMADGRPLFLAGLWASHTWEGETTESYTMVMQDTRPGDDMYIFHNRQPVILSREGAETWLDLGADYMPLLASPLPGRLAADPPEPLIG